MEILLLIEGGRERTYALKSPGKIDPFLNCKEFIRSALSERRTAKSLSDEKREEI